MSAALPTPLVLLAFFATYALHSTLLILCAWLLSRVLPRGARRAREIAWRAALLGPLATASLQVGLDLAPAGRRVDLSGLCAQPAAELPAADAAAELEAQAPLSTRSDRAAHDLDVGPALLAAAGRPARIAAALGAERLALLGWGAGAIVALLGLLRSLLSLRSHLSDREELTAGALPALLDDLCRRTGARKRPRLSCSHRLLGPLSLGIARPEICVPARAATDLSRSQQQALLAHELGHLARRDPLWQLAQRALAGALFFQPLNRLARRRLEDLAELAADDFAVRATGRAAPLARCLAEVATWIVGGRRHPAPAMAAAPSHLLRRVERLLERRGPPAPERRGGPALVLAALLLPAFAAGAPGATAAPRVSREPAGEPAAVRPEPAPDPMGAHVAALLAELDAEVSALDQELRSLAHEIESQGLAADYAAELAWIEARARDLRGRRDELGALAARILARAHRSSPAAPTPAPEAVHGREERP